MRIDLSISCKDWEDLGFDPAAAARKAIPAACERAELPGFLKDKELEVSLVLADDKTVRALNRDYRGKDKPTNVLSFATLDSPPEELKLFQNEEFFPLGDIVLAYETVAAEAEKMDIMLYNHYIHLLVHGTLHLLGYDHEQEDDADIMETLEIQILSQFDIENPYSNEKFVA